MYTKILDHLPIVLDTTKSATIADQALTMKSFIATLSIYSHWDHMTLVCIQS